MKIQYQKIENGLEILRIWQDSGIIKVPEQIEGIPVIGIAPYTFSLHKDEEEKKLISSFNLITLKPIIYALNVEDNDINTGNNYTKLVEDYAKKEGSETAIICAKLESELSELDEEEKKLFLDDLGIKESGVERLINKTYDLLGLATFFTVGKDEVRAWTFKKGSKAPECAGIIHSDFEKGFIKAEVMSYNDLVNAGSELKVRELGKARIEGQEYIMQDGDICHFRFNV